MKMYCPALSLFLLTYVFSTAAPNLQKANWWDLCMEIEVQGDYQLDRTGSGFSGKYGFDVILSAGFEKDSDGDIILYHGDCLVKDMSWVERVFQKNKNETVLDIGSRIEIHPRLVYLLKENERLVLNFEISSLKVPRVRGGATVELLLPRSLENRFTGPKSGYNGRVIAGSNDLYLEEKEITQTTAFSKDAGWQWQEKRSGWSHSHVVNIEIRVCPQSLRRKPGRDSWRQDTLTMALDFCILNQW